MNNEEPEPPLNARLVLTDGHVVPLTAIYEGFGHGGHGWDLIPTNTDDYARLSTLTSMPRLHVEKLPPHTAFRIPNLPTRLLYSKHSGIDVVTPKETPSDGR